TLTECSTGTLPPPRDETIIANSCAIIHSHRVGTVTPTPGGLGGFEVALVAGLTRIGPTAGQAVAAALAFRILTFWLPIIPGLSALRALRKRRLI
ncbi:MAG: lysylphosphatidylglycerol synthase domain-containing protein, partial [Acidimicrobiia bacterium]|nr:lysylphosphatidylglycerol synthase domain-containing protein [Acidimicrobiia bacterium]